MICHSTPSDRVGIWNGIWWNVECAFPWHETMIYVTDADWSNHSVTLDLLRLARCTRELVPVEFLIFWFHMRCISRSVCKEIAIHDATVTNFAVTFLICHWKCMCKTNAIDFRIGLNHRIVDISLLYYGTKLEFGIGSVSMRSTLILLRIFSRSICLLDWLI